MAEKDFKKYFQRLEICNLGPDSNEEAVGKKQWETSVFEVRTRGGLGLVRPGFGQ